MKSTPEKLRRGFERWQRVAFFVAAIAKSIRMDLLGND